VFARDAVMDAYSPKLGHQRSEHRTEFGE